MTHQDREEIERILHGIMDAQRGLNVSSFNESYLNPLMNFARQQLNLRVDGEKLAKKLGDAFVEQDQVQWILDPDYPSNIQGLEAIVLDGLTTDPLPTEQKEH